MWKIKPEIPTTVSQKQNNLTPGEVIIIIIFRYIILLSDEIFYSFVNFAENAFDIYCCFRFIGSFAN